MKVDQLVKYCILKYPSLFKTRVEVFIQLFSVIGNGYEWHKGQLISVGRVKDPTLKSIKSMKMDYSDLDERINSFCKELASYEKKYCLTDLTERFSVNYRFERMVREFVEKNIEIISKNINAKLNYNNNSLETNSNYYLDNPSYDYARIFHVPEDVNEDWAKAVKEFATFWRQRLYSKNFGFYHDKKKSKEEQADWDLAVRLSHIIEKMNKKLKIDTKAGDRVAKDVVNKFL